MQTIRLVYLPVFLLFTFTACKKSGDSCPATTNASITPNYTNVTTGWDLNLSVSYNSLLKYQWTGPNGWSVQATSGTVTRTNMQPQDAGVYTIKAYNTDNCLVQEGSIPISVAAIENAPCNASLANNTCTSDVPGLSSFTFNSVNLGYNPTNNSSQVGCYATPPSPANPAMSFTFVGHNRPRPGLYKTIYGFNAFGKENEISFYFSDPNTGKIYIASGGQNVYVTLVNGKEQICFCNTEVRDAPSGNLKTVSGKLTIGN